MRKVMNKINFFIKKVRKAPKRQALNTMPQNSDDIPFEQNDCRQLCSYKETPFVFFVKQEIDYLLRRANDKIKDIFEFKIGVELEFFCESNFDALSVSCMSFCKNNSIKIQGIVEECVKNQYEIQFDIYDDIFLLVEHYKILKEFLIVDFSADFRAKPRYFDAGNALQINLSLFKNGKNIFNGENNFYIQKAANGLVYYTNYFLPFYINNNACLERYEKEFNNYLYLRKIIPAPSFNACGINNRTASVRIPSPKNFRDKEAYEKEKEEKKRLEFRTPSGDSDIKLVLYGVLTSVYIGLKRNLPDTVFTNNNLFIDSGDYESIRIKNLYFGDIERQDDFF
jgi:glutamine synthetase